MTRTRTQQLEGAFFLVAFVATIFAANWLITNWGTIRFDPDGPWMIPVWPAALTPASATIYAPSGVLAIGLGFTLRDLVQRRLGVRWAVVAITAGTTLSLLLDPTLALASAASFLLAETLDLAVYTPLQRRNLAGAVLASNVVGIIADSLAFLFIAFGSLAFLEGQVIGKAWMTLVALPLILAIRRWDVSRGMPAYAA